MAQDLLVSDGQLLDGMVDELLAGLPAQAGRENLRISELNGVFEVDLEKGRVRVGNAGLLGAEVEWQLRAGEALVWRQHFGGKPAKLLAGLRIERRRQDRELMKETLRQAPFLQENPVIPKDEDLLIPFLDGLLEVMQRPDQENTLEIERSVTSHSYRFGLWSGIAELHLISGQVETQLGRVGEGPSLTWEPGQGSQGRTYHDRVRGEQQGKLGRLWELVERTYQERTGAAARDASSLRADWNGAPGKSLGREI